MIGWQSVVSASLALGIVVACAPSEKPDVRQIPSNETQSVKRPDKLSDFRFRWTAEPGIDLYSGAAVPLRAYAESWRVAQMMSDMSAAYPGFERAVPANRELTDQGVTVFTDRHLFFLGGSKNFRLPWKKLISIKMFEDGIEITKDSANPKPQILGVDDPGFAVNLVTRLT